MFKRESEGINKEKRVGFVGLGRSNLSVMEGLKPGTEVVLRSDKRILRSGNFITSIIRGEDLRDWLLPKVGEAIPKNVTVVGIYDEGRALSEISENVLVLSPSVRRDRTELLEAAGRGIRLTSDAQLFFDKAPCNVLAVTGSAGKSTTATLAHLMLGGKDGGSVLIGNVGSPMWNAPKEARFYVCELSSFMLSYCSGLIERSVITNITPNHLDWHSSFEEYRDSKLSVSALSRECVICADDPILSEWIGRKKIFSVASINLPLKELVSRHRAELYMTVEDGYICRNGEKIFDTGGLYRTDDATLTNACLAVALCSGHSATERIVSALCGFRGLSHRGETVGIRDGVKYVNSSIDTTPERSIATMKAINEQVILLLGGRGKGLSYEPLLPWILRYAKRVVCFGEEGDKIGFAINGAVPTVCVRKFSDAVRAAMLYAKRGDVVLLSPACTSYDEFSSFEERGDEFRRIVSEDK